MRSVLLQVGSGPLRLTRRKPLILRRLPVRPVGRRLLIPSESGPPWSKGAETRTDSCAMPSLEAEPRSTSRRNTRSAAMLSRGGSQVSNALPLGLSRGSERAPAA